MNLAMLARLNALRNARRAALTVTDLATGAVTLFAEADDPSQGGHAGIVAEGFRTGVPAFAAGPAGEPLFVSVYLPPPRLVVIGAVHISQGLAPMARLVGFDVTIIDPRTAFATPARFPEVSLLAEWPDEVFRRRPLDPFTALAALTHDPKIDDGALAAALRTNCFYVGALGSRKTHGKRLDRLRAMGFGSSELDRIHAPIGVPIGARSPAEIAVSILAELIAGLRARATLAAEAAA